MSLFTLDNVSFEYPSGEKILHALSLSIAKNSFTTILGPNGSGKTTLLKLLAKILSPLNGEIFFDHKPLRGLTQKFISKYLAYVPQQTAFTFSLPVNEYVELGRYPHRQGLSFGSERDRKIIKDVLLKMEVHHLKDRPIHMLSGGEKQRVVLARALAQEPKVLLLDEPTSALDIRYQIDLLKWLRRLQKEDHLTIICVLHDLSLASAFSDEIIFLKEKKLFAQGSAEKLLTEKHIQSVYGIDVRVVSHPLTHRPQILLAVS